MSQSLEAIRVLEMTEALAGPYCGMMLGDLGADVIKIERPEVGDQSRQWGPPFLNGESAYFLSVNRNKRSLALDIKDAEGLSALHQLIATADVFVTNIPRMASLQRAQIDPDTLRAINPRLIYVAISGYGHSGPKAGRSGYDLVAQGEAGLMAITGGEHDGPVRFPTPMSDITAGLYATIGILSALYAREKSGAGQFIDIALVDSQVTWLANIGGSIFATGARPRKIGNEHPTITPYQPLRARDKSIVIAVGTESLWRRFCKVLGVEQTLMGDPRFATNSERNHHRAELVSLLEEILTQRDADEWIEQFVANDIPAGPINFPDESLADPHLLAREMIVELNHPLIGLVRSIGNPVHLSETPPTYHRYPPRLGEHSEEILSELANNDPRTKNE
ncbi:MAG: CoA transferase [Chloroflexi bacterium]|nr:CoA transferase [Chloroflexota bacterium]